MFIKCQSENDRSANSTPGGRAGTYTICDKCYSILPTVPPLVAASICDVLVDAGSEPHGHESDPGDDQAKEGDKAYIEKFTENFDALKEHKAMANADVNRRRSMISSPQGNASSHRGIIQ